MTDAPLPGARADKAAATLNNPPMGQHSLGTQQRLRLHQVLDEKRSYGGSEFGAGALTFELKAGMCCYLSHKELSPVREARRLE